MGEVTEKKTDKASAMSKQEAEIDQNILFCLSILLKPLELYFLVLVRESTLFERTNIVTRKQLFPRDGYFHMLTNSSLFALSPFIEQGFNDSKNREHFYYYHSHSQCSNITRFFTHFGII